MDEIMKQIGILNDENIRLVKDIEVDVTSDQIHEYEQAKADAYWYGQIKGE